MAILLGRHLYCIRCIGQIANRGATGITVVFEYYAIPPDWSFQPYYWSISGKRKLCTKQINLVRTIITATGTDILLNIAPEYVGKRVEITYLALDELQNDGPIPDQSLSSLWNSLNDDAAQQLRDAVDKVRSEWE